MKKLILGLLLSHAVLLIACASEMVHVKHKRTNAGVGWSGDDDDLEGEEDSLELRADDPGQTFMHGNWRDLLNFGARHAAEENHFKQREQNAHKYGNRNDDPIEVEDPSVLDGVITYIAKKISFPLERTGRKMIEGVVEFFKGLGEVITDCRGIIFLLSFTYLMLIVVYYIYVSCCNRRRISKEKGLKVLKVLERQYEGIRKRSKSVGLVGLGLRNSKRGSSEYVDDKTPILVLADKSIIDGENNV